MPNLSRLINRTPVARSDSPPASPGHEAAKPAPLVRKNAARDVSLPAPIGKRATVKRLLTNAFSLGTKPTALAGPVRRQAKSTASSGAHGSGSVERGPTTAEQFKVMMEQSKEVRSSGLAGWNGKELTQEEIRDQADEAAHYHKER